MSTVSVLNTDAQLNAKTLALIGSANSGNLLFTDATYDIGQSGATRPRDLFLSRNAVVGGTLGVTGVASFTAAPTVAAGIQFPATQAPSADPNTLDDYEEGTFVPTDASGAALSFTNPVGQYVKFGQKVDAWLAVIYPATASGANAIIGSLPFTALAFANGGYPGSIGFSNNSLDTYCYVNPGTTSVLFYKNTGAAILNSDMNGRTVYVHVSYRASA